LPQAQDAKVPSILALAAALVLLISGCAGGVGERGGAAQGTQGAPEAKTGAAGETSGETARQTDGGGEAERLSVRDAVGQMFVVGMAGTEPDYYIEKMVRERNIGGVLLFGYNMRSAEQTKALTDSLQRLSMRTEPGIPMFVAVDHEGGLVRSAPWVRPEPAAADVGATGDPEVARAVAGRIGRQLRQGGVNTDFAPVVDTGFGAAISTRSYGEDPALVSRMGAAAVRGFEGARIISAAKHFPNHGPATEDSHVGRPVVDHDGDTLRGYDLPPFEAAVRAGAPMVMVGHLVYPAIDAERPASLSPAAYRLLRSDLGFRGVAVTDDLAMEGATRGGTPAEAAVKAVEAGADLLVISSPPQEQADAYDAVVAAVESGEIPRERIDESVRRILEVKGRYLSGGAG
jgi:beta-N-acetylhexosaminidase